MPFVSKTVEVDADAASILAIVADFESYPQWNQEIKGLWVLARYDDGRPSLVTANPTTSRSGKCSSEKYRQPDSATMPCAAMVTGSTATFVLIQPLIAVSKSS